MEEAVHCSLRFWKESPQWRGRGGSLGTRQLEQEAERSPLLLQARKQKEQNRSGKYKLSKPTSSDMLPTAGFHLLTGPSRSPKPTSCQARVPIPEPVGRHSHSNYHKHLTRHAPGKSQTTLAAELHQLRCLGNSPQLGAGSHSSGSISWCRLVRVGEGN